jgi:hypothetical protein
MVGGGGAAVYYSSDDDQMCLRIIVKMYKDKEVKKSVKNICYQSVK